MRELVLQMGVSIDAYVATVDGAHDWGYDGEDPAMTEWSWPRSGAARAHLMPTTPSWRLTMRRTVHSFRTFDSVLAPAPAS
jgi:hypothetical protein